MTYNEFLLGFLGVQGVQYWLFDFLLSLDFQIDQGFRGFREPSPRGLPTPSVSVPTVPRRLFGSVYGDLINNVVLMLRRRGPTTDDLGLRVSHTLS